METWESKDVWFVYYESGFGWWDEVPLDMDEPAVTWEEAGDLIADLRNRVGMEDVRFKFTNVYTNQEVVVDVGQEIGRLTY